LCPTRTGGFETEVPLPEYDIVVFENRFPSLNMPPLEPEVQGSAVVPVRPSSGICEVICYSSDHDATFATMPEGQVRKLTRVWQDRYIELAALDAVEYVFIFENKGAQIGVTLSHPHGQIYAYPFIPPVPAAELLAEREHFESAGRSLFADWLAWELEEETGRRVVDGNEDFVALVPFFARYPYEVHVVARREVPSLREMDWRELDSLGAILQSVARRYDRLFGFSLPYIMAMHQAPPRLPDLWTRFHVEFYPPNRTAEKLKYLAGSEAGAGAFINDVLPETAAQRLRDG
jgi:UDPglucose--hexose-1-phosphate uridylyltransferase